MAAVSKEEYLKQLRVELHKPARKKYPRRKVYVPLKDHTWALDLVDMRSFSTKNRGYKWIINIIDVWSRYAWSVPMKSKNAADTLQAVREVIDSSGRKPEFIWVDEGKEFYNSQMTEYIDTNDIKRYSTFGEGKSVMVERLNRTLKEQMWKRFTELQTHNWIDHQESLLNWYNHKPHRGIANRTPYSMSKYPDAVQDNEFCLQVKPASFLKPKFKIGDFVRLARDKGVFEKGYTEKWSQEQFIVSGIRESLCDELPMYSVVDWYKEPVRGMLYEPQLQLVKFGNIYLVEKVLKHDKVGKRLLVKWIGFDSRHNKWIPEENVLE